MEVALKKLSYKVLGINPKVTVLIIFNRKYKTENFKGTILNGVYLFWISNLTETSHTKGRLFPL